MEALLKWKRSLSDQSQSVLSSWNFDPRNTSSPAISPCSWLGISCNDAGSIARINLTYVELEGTLDEFHFSALSNLSSLDLHYNSLTGKIPPEISNLSKLTILNLGYNQFHGYIPKEIGDMIELNVLSFSNNLLSGSVPAGIGNLTNLSVLNLANNYLSGSIPPQLGKLRSLIELRLNLNNFTSSIPSSIGDLTSLKVLSLYGNQLSGPLPQGINKLTNLTLIFLSNNSISGLLPENICHGGILEDFCASNNLFTASFIWVIFIGVFCILKTKRRNKISNKLVDSQHQNLFKIWSYDGKLVYADIEVATEGFNSKYCIGVGGHGSVYKAKLSTGVDMHIKGGVHTSQIYAIHQSIGKALEEVMEQMVFDASRADGF
ncbi:hypothetical protein GH714_020480 [Hevea brasiliensis]|uniref:Uncharacterized protein n=1 Tax=Hevea brasiliensis TaxID=3981 RepID=A0A6A6MU86_HEVBR|nr:hypothetical protein GH714_020480 [Hevea brasiliensis]